MRDIWPHVYYQFNFNGNSSIFHSPHSFSDFCTCFYSRRHLPDLADRNQGKQKNTTSNSILSACFRFLSVCFLSVFSVCVFSLCFLSVFSLCVFSVCVFCLCFLSVFSLCVFSVCVFCLCLLSGSLIPDAFPRKTRLA